MITLQLPTFHAAWYITRSLGVLILYFIELERVYFVLFEQKPYYFYHTCFTGKKCVLPKTPPHPITHSTPLQSILEVLHSRQSPLVGQTDQFVPSFNPKNASETKAVANIQQIHVQRNIIWSTQQDFCTYEYDISSLVLDEIIWTHNPTQTYQITTHP